MSLTSSLFWMSRGKIIGKRNDFILKAKVFGGRIISKTVRGLFILAHNLPRCSSRSRLVQSFELEAFDFPVKVLAGAEVTDENFILTFNHLIHCSITDIVILHVEGTQ